MPSSSQQPSVNRVASLPPGPGRSFRGAWSFIYRPKEFYAWARRRYGNAVTLSSGDMPLVMLLTSEGARQTLTADPDNYDALHKEPFTGVTGAGSLWVLEGTRHRQERQLLSPQFSAHRVRQYGDAIKQIALRHTDAWQPGQSIQAYRRMLDISRDVILLIMFSLERGPLMDQACAVLKKLLERFHPLLSLHPMFQAWWFPPWVRYQAAKREFHQFVDRCLAERRAGDSDRHDVFACMLSARGEHGRRMSDDEIRDELITILLAGHETTAVALAWALYELSRHRTILERLRQELDALGPDAAPDEINKQPYLGAVCDETLRLHTILTEIGRITRSSCRLAGIEVAANTGIGIGIGAIHQDPSLYPEPYAFRPERFLERKYAAFEFLPFGGGHRRCLGAHLSDYEMRVVLATIVTIWEFEPAAPDSDIRHNIGTGPKHGVRLRLKGRRQRTASMPAAQ
jgi:cytochrome P450